jgi:hypothetical protein
VCGGYHLRESLAIDGLAIVVSERLFIQIAEQVEWLDANVRRGATPVSITDRCFVVHRWNWISFVACERCAHPRRRVAQTIAGQISPAIRQPPAPSVSPNRQQLVWGYQSVEIQASRVQLSVLDRTQ